MSLQMGMKGGKTALKLPIFGVILGHYLLNSIARKQFCMLIFVEGQQFETFSVNAQTQMT